jgi:hypothetical protein
MKITLFKRLTNKYRLGWDDLNTHQFLGVAKMLTPRLVEDHGIDGKMHMTRIIVPAALGSADLSYAISSSLSYSHCRHEHDCCGCATVGADVRRLSRRQYSVKLFTSYNV